MDRNLPDIEELFKSALENEEEMPEPKVWQAIEGILDKENVISIKKKYSNLKKVAFLLFFMRNLIIPESWHFQFIYCQTQ